LPAGRSRRSPLAQERSRRVAQQSCGERSRRGRRSEVGEPPCAAVPCFAGQQGSPAAAQEEKQPLSRFVWLVVYV